MPIVFAAVIDPIGAAFVASLNRPGGNVTGFTTTNTALAAKWLELLKDVAPRVKHVAVLFHPSNPSSQQQGPPSKRWRHRSPWELTPIPLARRGRVRARGYGVRADLRTAG